MPVSSKINYRIINAEYVTSAYDVQSLPVADIREIAFIGRSNVGKSSLINKLCQKLSLARVSKTPGRTQSFNYFDVTLQILSDEGTAGKKERVPVHFVDLPGYGFAEAPKRLSRKWPEQIEEYLLKREQLAGLLLLVDARRNAGEEEKWIAQVGAQGNLVAIMTKCDKLSNNEIAKSRVRLKTELKLPESRIIAVSSMPGKRSELDKLHTIIGQWLLG